MRIQIVFADADKRLCIGRCTATEFLLLEMSGRTVARSGDTLAANFTNNVMADAFNETRGSLLQMRVLKKFSRLDEALRMAKNHVGSRGSRQVK